MDSSPLSSPLPASYELPSSKPTTNNSPKIATSSKSSSFVLDLDSSSDSDGAILSFKVSPKKKAPSINLSDNEENDDDLCSAKNNDAMDIIGNDVLFLDQSEDDGTQEYPAHAHLSFVPWNCSQCTYTNDASSNRCLGCDGPR